MNSLALSRQDTSVLKGIAICAMLLHHMYACPIADNIEPYTGFLQWMGILGKVCVSIFLFCSGYGLSVQFRTITGLDDSVSFIRRRLIKFYTNYWVVFVIFVPITVLFFNRPLSVPYGKHYIIRLFVDLLGLQVPSYNITWWFNQLIIILYLLFPLLFWMTRYLGVVLSLAIGFLFFRFHGSIPGNFAGIYFWQFPFLLGVVGAFIGKKAIIGTNNQSNLRILGVSGALVIMMICVFLRMKVSTSFYSGVSMDPFISASIASLLLFMPKKAKVFFRVFSFLGKHSMNIYLTHTFINHYWHPEWLHTSTWMRCGLNFFVLMSICLTISLILEWTKKNTGIYSLMKRFIGEIHD